MNHSVLLVEPAYRSKYPPLGLMKISQYHKAKGDQVEFVKGLSVEKRDKTEWDRIYISSLFTYDWAQTIKTIKYYRYSAKEPCSENVVVGGILATLMSDDIQKEVSCRVVKGRLNQIGKLGYDDDDIIDGLTPDYSILDETDYVYPAGNAYFAYTTRGCIRKCTFCAVPTLEPEYEDFFPVSELVKKIDAEYGQRKDLLLLDNNVLASERFGDIIQDIKQAGFFKGAAVTYKAKSGQSITKKRYVDFNQGVDARLLTEGKMAMLSEIAIRPLRIAFDNISYKDIYKEKIRLAAKYKISHLSNYMLFNYTDRPEELYQRLKINIELNEELGLQIFSFPMRYIDLLSKDRLASTAGNMGQYWNKKYLRAVQTVLTATRGVVGTKRKFFEKAFGKDIDEFFKILIMPEDYIRNRLAREEDGSTEAWWRLFCDMNLSDREIALSIISHNKFKDISNRDLSADVLKLLEHYAPGGTRQLALEYEPRSALEPQVALVSS